MKYDCYKMNVLFEKKIISNWSTKLNQIEQTDYTGSVSFFKYFENQTNPN